MKIIDIALKDLSHFFRSAFAIGMAVVAPLMLTGLIYFAFGGASSGTSNLPTVKVGVVNLDSLPANSPLDAPLGDNIRSMFFDDSVKSWIVASDFADEASARAAVDKQQIGVAVIIPQNFTEHFLNGKKDIQVLIINDPTLSIGPTVVQNMVTSMLDGVSGGSIALETIIERQQVNGITPDPTKIPSWISVYENWYASFQRNLFHQPEKAALVMVAPAATQTETENPIQKLLGMTMAGQLIFFAFFTGAYAMMSILREDEDGTLARLFTTSTNRTIILAGKFTAVFLIVILQSLVLIIASHFAFGINWGSTASVALAVLGQVIAASGLGVFMISFAKNSRQAGPILGGGLSVLGMLSGLFTVSVPNMPQIFNTIANFTPQGWVLQTWRMVLNGQPINDLLVPFFVLVMMGGIMFVIGAMMFRKRFA